MKAIVWSKYNCPYCDQAKALLKQKDIPFEERKIGDGYTRVPQIFLDDELVGGFTELRARLTEVKQ